MAKIYTAKDKHFADLGNLCEAIVSDSGPPVLDRPLQRILAVGAIVAGHRLSSRDHRWFEETLSVCGLSKICVPASFQYIPYSMSQGNDFLNPNLQIKSIDVLTVNLILDPDKALKLPSFQKLWGALEPQGVKRPHDAQSFRSALSSRAAVKYMESDELTGDMRGLVVSPYHTRTAWQEAARRVGARLIITFSNEEDADIDQTNFIGTDYERVYKFKTIELSQSIKSQTHRFPINMALILHRDLHEEMERKGLVIPTNLTRDVCAVSL